MKRTRFLVFFSSLLSGLIAGISGQSAATDLEIYLGRDQVPGGQQIRPNILFLLDSSGSMSNQVADTGGNSRLDEMKIAFKSLMDTTTNVNVGLMRFTDPGGPILYPVAFIDEDTAVIEGPSGGASPTGADVQVRISSNADDAEQNQATNSIDLSDPALTLGQVTQIAASLQTLDVRTQSNNDDAEEDGGDTDVTSGDLDIESGKTNGIRFQLAGVPQGAFVADAFIELTASDNDNGGTQVTWRAENEDTAPAFIAGTNNDNITGRNPTAAAVNWSPPNFVANNTYQTPNVGPIVQEIVNRGGWNPGNFLAFIQSHNSGPNRRVYSHDGAGATVGQRPRLLVTYVDFSMLATPADNFVGLRFREIDIPQGATITSAHIEFVSRTNGTDPNAAYLIEGELTPDAAEFTGTPNNISGRTPTTANVTWNAASGLTAWDIGMPYQTPDLTAIVQEVVNQPGWCGNNNVSFRISNLPGTAIDARVANSHEASPSLAPVLRINWDESIPPAGSGCINQIFQYQVSESNDDAEETIATNATTTSGPQLDMNANQVNGIRFQRINIPQGATVLEANVTLVARDTDSGAATATWAGQAIDDAPPFSASNSNISNRATTTASVADVMDDWTVVGSDQTSGNLATIFQEIINRPGWVAGNDIALIQTATGTRRARTFDHAAASAPKLRLKVQFSGAVIPPLAKPVRVRLKEMADSITASGFTPLVGQYYEAAQYYRGGPVFHGARRSHRPEQVAVTRLSHPASYTGGTYNDPGNDCSPTNLNAAGCFDETVTNGTYVSPIDVGCQASYIVLLTDGFANHNADEEGTDHNVDLAQALAATGGLTCTGISGEFCGRELAEFMATVDQRPDLPGDQIVRTYTIGFNFSNQYLADVAAAGDGQFFTANNAGQLAAVFQAIISDILNQPTSLAAPALTVNAFNQLFNRNEVYFALFEPSDRARWSGNVKKYFVCDGTQFTGCTIPELLDATGTPAVDGNGQFIDSARSIWSPAADGANIDLGGAASQLPNSSTRKVLTYTGLVPPVNVSLDQVAHRVPNNIDCSPEAIASDPPPSTCTAIVNDNPLITNAMLGFGATNNLARVRLLNWITGQDTDDEDEDNDRSEDRFAFGASLHASPVVITYGGTALDPVDKVFVSSTNGLQMINGKTGQEEWLFMPQALLAQQEAARLDAFGDPVYGFDLSPTTWVSDVDDDGEIDPSAGEFARVFTAMRRGGQNLYAFDVTPAVTVNDPNVTGLIPPTLMWRIEGGVTPGFANLGQTWSPPQVADVLIDVAGVPVKTTVLIFGGGHDDSLDKDFQVSNIGNVVYIVDALTGTLLTSIGGTGTTAALTVPGMDYPINTPISLRDVDGDGNSERLYFADEGGNVWRIDLKVFNASSLGGSVATVGQLADIAISAGATPGPIDDPADLDDNPERRRFFASTAAIPVRDTLFSDESDYEYVLVQSGNRPAPLNQVIHNAFYAFRDYRILALPDADSDGIADLDVPDADGWPNTPLTRAELFDVTDNPFQTAPDGTPVVAANFDEATAGSAINGIRSADGWFIDLKELDGAYIGEKGFTRPNVFFGNLFFTTYIPEVTDQLQNQCQVSAGFSRLYGLNLLTGAALFADWDNPTSGQTPDKSTRAKTLGGGGIASDPLIIISEGGTGGLAGSGAGGESFPTGATLPIQRTYWFQQ